MVGLWEKKGEHKKRKKRKNRNCYKRQRANARVRDGSVSRACAVAARVVNADDRRSSMRSFFFLLAMRIETVSFPRPLSEPGAAILFTLSLGFFTFSLLSFARDVKMAMATNELG